MESRLGIHQKRIVIVGLGVTGLSVARFLAKHGAPFSLVDSRIDPPGKAVFLTEFPRATACFGEFNEGVLAQAELLIVNPGVSVHTPALAAAKARGAELIGDVALFCRAANAPVIAVTGSNGKSTVVSMLASVANAANKRVGVGGNLGEPVLGLLDEQAEAYLLELSSFQLETTQGLNAACAAVLNVSEDHLDRYDSFAAYAETKRLIYQRAKHAVCFRADPETVPREACAKLSCVSDVTPASGEYGLRLDAKGQAVVAYGETPLMAVSEMGVAGRHNALNACFVWAIARSVGWPDGAIRQGLRQFAGLPHRLQRVAELDGVLFINDSKATNVGAAVSALMSMDRPCVLIAGGDAKGSDMGPLRAAIAQACKAVVVFGQDADKIARIMPSGVPLKRVSGLSQAVIQAKAQAQAGDCVLLSPACSSWDMYKNYQERGHEFEQLVTQEFA